MPHYSNYGSTRLIRRVNVYKNQGQELTLNEKFANEDIFTHKNLNAKKNENKVICGLKVHSFTNYRSKGHFNSFSRCLIFKHDLKHHECESYQRFILIRSRDY